MDYGIWWHEQLKDGGWKTHEIDKTFSQTHSVVPGRYHGRWPARLRHGQALVGSRSGRRRRGPGEPQVLYWYELKRHDGQADFVRHEIDNHSGVGTQFEVIDVNGDGLLDIAIANKSGVYLFEQSRE